MKRTAPGIFILTPETESKKKSGVRSQESGVSTATGGAGMNGV